MSKLAELLGKLKSDPGSVRLLLLDGTGVDPDKVDLSGDITTVWDRVLQHAWLRHRVPVLIDAVAAEIPERREELLEAQKQFLAARNADQPVEEPKDADGQGVKPDKEAGHQVPKVGAWAIVRRILLESLLALSPLSKARTWIP